jgi:starch phosphorylase
MPRSRQEQGLTPRVAYFSMEIAVDRRLPPYSGGLGILAGDSLKAAADLSLPVIGVTLAHREGYFRQELDASGRQSENPDPWDPASHARELEPRITVEIEGRKVVVRAWEYVIEGFAGGRVPVYMLDTDLHENIDNDRALTDHLYGGDRRYRLKQEAILGIGGIRMLRALGRKSFHTYHLNEGHSSLLCLALLEERAGSKGVAHATAKHEEAVREHCVFTTHTPVPAGHDRFEPFLVEEVLGHGFAAAVQGRGTEDGGVLNMSRLGLHFSRWSNGVAFRHGEVSRAMFPGLTIHAITNGVHVPTWTAPAMAELFDRTVPGWRTDASQLRHAITVPLEDVRAAHRQSKTALLAEVERLTGRRMNPGVCTVAFGRRATPYKRADLILTDPARLISIAKKAGGLQLLFAGKAHPRDEGGKALIRRIRDVAKGLGDEVPLAYLPNYDMDLAKLLTSGADVWLNTPEKPKEASGTSGMKACLNGVPNLSVLDGWWIEGHLEGITGWSLDKDWRDPADRAAETETLYAKLENVILPLYYKDPTGYDRVRRGAIAFNGGHFSTSRMMIHYALDAYGLHLDMLGPDRRNRVRGKTAAASAAVAAAATEGT